jgi:uncharacterized membrane protein YbjE (DUF340 family)
MLIIIGIMFLGIASGYLLRKRAILQHIGKSIRYTILLLLFTLGVAVGSNQEIISRLPSLGGQSLWLAFAGTLGSVLAAWAVDVLFFKSREK